MMPTSRRAWCAGQAAIEAVALVPVLFLVALAAWQLAAIGVAALRADEQLRRQGLSPNRVERARIVNLRSEALVAMILPGTGPISVVARGAVRVR